MERLKLDDFTRYTFLSGVEYNPSGSRACFVVHKADMEENGYSSNLWLYDVGTGDIGQLTAWDKVKGFIWLDDDTVLFPDAQAKDREKAKEGEVFTVYYKISVKGGKRGSLSDSLAVRSIQKLDDSRSCSPPLTIPTGPAWKR